MVRLLSEYSPGSLVFTSEPMDGEIRETFYLRDPERPCKYDYNVPIGRLGFVQGDLMSSKPRVVRIRTEPCRDPGEADGRITVRPISESTFYSLVFPENRREF